MRILSVIACDPSNGFYYPGYARKQPEFATTTVTFYCRRQLEIPSEQIIELGGARPWPNLQIGDFALVSVFCRTLREGAYVPAEVMVLPEISPTYTKLYTLRLFNGVVVHKARRLIVKISKDLYESAVANIMEIRRKRPILFDSMDGLWPRTGKLLKRRGRQSAPVLNRCRSPYLRKVPMTKELYRIYGAKSRNYSSAPASRRPRKIASADHILNIICRSSAPRRLPPRPHSKSNSQSSSKSSLNYNGNGPVTYNGRLLPNITISRMAKTAENHARSENDTTKGNNTRVADADDKDIHVDRVEEAIRCDSPTSSTSKKSSKSYPEDDYKNVVVKAASPEPPKTDMVVVEVEDSYSEDTFEDSDDSSSDIKNSNTSGKHKHKTSKSTLSKVSSVSSIHRNRKLRKIETGQEVLARWPDDGWYYFSEVVMEIDDDRFVVRDSTGHIETVTDDNILTESQQLFEVIQPGDLVVGLHPNFLYSYAPAVVREVYHLGMRVDFYDMTEARLPFEEVFKLAPGKYQQDVDYIRQCEERVCRENGGDVIARDDATGFYIRCFAECPAGRSFLFLRMLNGAYRKQVAIHVFERTSPLSSYSGPKDNWLYVLAPWDEDNETYLPAIILQRYPLTVKFTDGYHKTLESLKDCFLLSEDYYRNAVNFYIEKSSRDIASAGRVLAW